jgi:hypothetical protein
MNLNDLLHKQGIEPAGVLVFRHSPKEPRLRKVLPWLAGEKPELFNAYQQTQSLSAEKACMRAKFVASFIGVDAGKALFAGLYRVEGWETLTYEQYWKKPANIVLHDEYGMEGSSGDRPITLWFNLVLDESFYGSWRGRMVIGWKGELAWWRWAAKNTFNIDSIRDSLAFERAMPPANTLVLTWSELKILPSNWQASLREWRGIYFIWDTSAKCGYVGSAYGSDNIFGRWRNYAATGDGGNKKLRDRDPNNFRFSILQRVSQDMPAEEVIELESSWKTRLHTREDGLNIN